MCRISFIKLIYENTVKSFSNSVKHFVQNKIVKVVKEFDISKPKGESYDILVILTESQEELARIFRVVLTPAP